MISPKVFVLILSYNGVTWLKECLPSVIALEYPNFNILVIDNGSTDGTTGFIQSNYQQVHVLRLNKNRGYAGGFNAGLEYAAEYGADFFLIMNNDTVIDKHALAALMSVGSSKDRAGFVTGKVYFYDKPGILQSVGKEEHPITWIGRHIGVHEKDNGQYDEITERVFVDDIYTLVSRNMYDEIGGYDTHLYLHCEEFDWQLRARKAGWKIYYTPYAKLWHHASASIGGVGSPINNYFLERSLISVMVKHGSTKQVLLYFLWSSSQAFFKLIIALLQLKLDNMKPQLARLVGIIDATFWLIHRRPPTAIPWIVHALS